MPRIAQFNKTFDSALKIDITKLKEWGYLKSNQSTSGILTWSRNEIKTGSISFTSFITDDNKYIVLDYSFNDEPRKYKIKLIQKDSNLGKGSIWFFLCPNTNKLCRKLYLINGYFLHREAHKNTLYESQTYSKFYRFLDNHMNDFQLERLYQELYSKHFKKSYKGKPTKRYLSLMNKINRIESLPPIPLSLYLKK